MSLDYAGAIATNSDLMLDALAAAPDGALPWCGAWTVKDCAWHVASLHHVVGQVVAGRPDVTFAAFDTLNAPAADDPELGAWWRKGTAALLDEVARADPAEPCWTFSRPDQLVGFWPRRVAHETFVHRWDVERGASRPVSPIDPVLASDGVDEYLSVFVPRMRHVAKAPGSGETVHLHCTDSAGEWLVAFTGPGTQELRREHAKGDAAIRGPAESLLLFLWGRLDAREGGLEVIGDEAVAGRWRELSPPI
jgi:uncharacterized protein (TIGR03083 family)